MNKDYLSTIKTTVTEILDSIPDRVLLVAAAKTRSLFEQIKKSKYKKYLL